MSGRNSAAEIVHVDTNIHAAISRNEDKTCIAIANCSVRHQSRWIQVGLSLLENHSVDFSCFLVLCSLY